MSFDNQRLCRLLPKIWEMESKNFSGEQGPENVEFIFSSKSNQLPIIATWLRYGFLLVLVLNFGSLNPMKAVYM